MLTGLGMMRVGLIFIVVATVDVAVNRLALFRNIAQRPGSLIAHRRSFIAAQRCFAVNFGVELPPTIVAFHMNPL
ncbi:MAG: hypothetical protein ACREML_10545 [Vulcanimicrobiaceae bacterium]